MLHELIPCMQILTVPMEKDNRVCLMISLISEMDIFSI